MPAEDKLPQARGFPTTIWSMVLAAARDRSAGSHNALESLCIAYWPPVYAYVRSRGYCKDDAQDLTQAYFERLLEKKYLNEFRPERGRFRSFLLASLNHFLANEYDRANRLKRGGGQEHVNLELDLDEAENRYGVNPGHNLSPEKVFEQRWALRLLERTRGTLAEEMRRAGKEEQFQRLEPLAFGEGADVPYRDVAKALRTSEGAIKVGVHRMRRRFRELLRDEVGQTVDSPDLIDEELRFLLKVIGKV